MTQTIDLAALLAADLADTATRMVLADALAELDRAEEETLLRDTSQCVVVRDGVVVRAMAYALRMRDHGGSQEHETLLAVDQDEAEEMAAERTRDWVREGDWGEQGGEIGARWTLTVAVGEELAEDHVTVLIEPDHESLIRTACGAGAWGRGNTWDRCCGGDPDDHDWTGEGEGGLAQNPGVWSDGNGAINSVEHCRTCGLRRREHRARAGNCGDQDTVAYEMPPTWCGECEREECSCEEE